MTSGLQPYREYKESGLPWLGKVPKHWRLATLRRVAKVQLSNVDKHSLEGEDPIRLCNYTDVYHHRYIRPDIRFMKATALPREIEKFELQRGDVLITKDSEDWKDIAVPALVTEDMPGVLCGYHLAHIRPGEELYGEYLMWACRSERVALQFRTAANGVTRYGVSGPDIKAGLLPLPPLAEQKAIGVYLREMEQKVNRFIRNRRRLIEVFNEQKQAIINRAVTRGIDPNVRLKASGIEWLGAIPEHWAVCRLRNVVNAVTSGSRGWSSYAANSGPLFIRIANLRRVSLDLRFDDVVRLNVPNTSEVQRTRISSGDLLISITAYIGSIAVVPPGFEEAYVSQHVARCSPCGNRHNPRWLGYVLLSDIGQTHGRLSLYGGTKDGLSLDDVKNYPIILPPRDEQDRIVEKIDWLLSASEAAVSRTQQQIDLIREYRTRLISDVVTGKLDVHHLGQDIVDEFLETEDLDEGIDDEERLRDEELALDEEAFE